MLQLARPSDTRAVQDASPAPLGVQQHGQAAVLERGQGSSVGVIAPAVSLGVRQSSWKCPWSQCFSPCLWLFFLFVLVGSQ